MPWGEALQREILDPLGMSRTSLLPQEPHARGWAVHPWADVIQPEVVQETGRMAPAGQLWSTIDDLCRVREPAFLRARRGAKRRNRRRDAHTRGRAGGGVVGFGLRAGHADLSRRRPAAGRAHRLDARFPLRAMGQRGRRPGRGLAHANTTSGIGDRAALRRSAGHRRRPRAADSRAVAATVRCGSGGARADRAVVLGSGRAGPQASRRRPPGARRALRSRLRHKVPPERRRHLDRAQRLLRGRNAAPVRDPQRQAFPFGHRQLRVHP